MDVEQTARAQAEPAPEGWCICDRLLGLSNAARLMEGKGWTLEGATLETAEEQSAGEVVATAVAEDGSTIVYRLHLAADQVHWYHSIEEIFDPTQRWVASFSDEVIPVDYARWWLMERQRERELADRRMTTALKESLARV